MTSMHSSHSPSTVVNIESVRFGRPDSRTTRTAAATADDTESPVPEGATEKATSMAATLRVVPAEEARGQRGQHGRETQQDQARRDDLRHPLAAGQHVEHRVVHV